MPHDRIHAREPAHDRERYQRGTITDIGERDGHCVVTVRRDDEKSDDDDDARSGGNGAGRGHDCEHSGDDGQAAHESVELVVTFAVRDLFVSRLRLGDHESPIGEQVWYRKRGGR